MDQSRPEGVSPRAATRDAQCDEHGPYTANQIYGSIFSRCPDCLAEVERKQKARRDEDERKERQARAAASLAFNLRNCGLAGRFAEGRATFETFHAKTRDQRTALKTCRDFADAFLPTAGGGLWLVGPPGVGKTHLGAAMVTHAINVRGLGACMHAAHEIMAMLRARYGVKGPSAWGSDGIDTTDDLLEHLGSIPLLVLDEVGVSRGNDHELGELFKIIDARYQRERPTVLLSNLPAIEIKAAIGDRAYDRLREGARLVPMNWPSHRGSRS